MQTLPTTRIPVTQYKFVECRDELKKRRAPSSLIVYRDQNRDTGIVEEWSVNHTRDDEWWINHAKFRVLHMSSDSWKHFMLQNYNIRDES